MAEGIITRKGKSSSEKLCTEILIRNANWIVPKAKDQKFSVRIFGGGGGYGPPNYGASGGGGGWMNNDILDLQEGSIINISIGYGGVPGYSGGTTTFGTYLSANGGTSGITGKGGNGGSGGGGDWRNNGGDGYQFGGGGAGGGATWFNSSNTRKKNSLMANGGNGGIWGGGGGGSGAVFFDYLNRTSFAGSYNSGCGYGGKGGQYGGNGGNGWGNNGNNGTNTINLNIEFIGAGNGGINPEIMRSEEDNYYYTLSYLNGYWGGAGGGGYGGNGGIGGPTHSTTFNYEYGSAQTGSGGGGGGYGGNGGNGIWAGGGGGGGYGGDGDNGTEYASGVYAGGGGGGYGIFNLGSGGTYGKVKINSPEKSYNKTGSGMYGVCIIQYYI